VSNEFRPGHPIVFWIAIVVLTFAFYSGATAGVTIDKCNGDEHAEKGWVVFPPHWQCGASGVKLTASD
jgi:hypothetical protein